mgnify:CR=1 FL=1
MRWILQCIIAASLKTISDPTSLRMGFQINKEKLRMKILFVGLGSIGQRHLRNLRQLLGSSIDVLAYRALRQVPVLDEQRQIVEGRNIKDYYHVREFNDLSKALAEEPNIAFITNPSAAVSAQGIFVERDVCPI